ncbi:MAG TPA: hypothetical protein VGR58_05325 [Candidatus Acidoferrum sp.]|nr:hypothetical protein [Candidatus Acidoferrum sp.]
MPAGWVALAVEAGDYHNPMFLHVEEDSIGEPAHSRAAYAPMNERELQGMLGDGLNCSRDRQDETFP